MSDELPRLRFPPDEPPQEENLRYTVYTAGPIQIGWLKFVGVRLRIFGSIDKPLFIGREVCQILGLALTPVALKNHPATEKLLYPVDIAGQVRTVLFVNEPGLYRLIFKSRRAEAEAFKTFIFAEVLPCIRRYGKYPVKELTPIEPPRLTPELDSYLPEDARRLPLRNQVILAERLKCVRAVALAPHFSLMGRCRLVAQSIFFKRRGFSAGAIYKLHRRFVQCGEDWHCLATRFERSGRRKRGA